MNPPEEPRVAPTPSAQARGVAPEIESQRQRGLRRAWRLLVADYEAGYAYKGEDPRRLRRLMLPRLLTNASLHANILIRLLIATPQPLAYLWRRLLISTHSMDISRDITIGPGLELPHPFGIAIGINTRIGANVRIHHGASIGPAGRSGAWYPGNPEVVSVGDRVILYPYCHVQADMGHGSAVLTHGVVIRPVGDDTVVAGSPARPVRRLDDQADSPPSTTST